MIYVDSAVLVKLYLLEPDSEFWRDRLDGRTDLATSALSLPEVKCAFRQKTHRGDIRPKSAQNLWKDFSQSIEKGMVRLFPLSGTIVESAVQMLDELSPRILLRTLDALHLATARYYDCTALATTDARLRMSAESLNVSLF